MPTRYTGSAMDLTNLRSLGMRAVDVSCACGRRESVDADYAVGYGRPPIHTRFQPGRSGNPKGRPRGSKNFTTLVNEELAKRVTVLENGEPLTPRQNSSGGKHKLGRISKMGNRYLRKLLVVGAHAVLHHRKPHTDALRTWAKKLMETKPFKLVAVALANKLARMVFAILRSGASYAAEAQSRWRKRK